MGSIPRLENEDLRKLGLENGPEALFHRLPSFHYDEACPQQTELFSVCSLYSELDLTSAGAPQTFVRFS